MAKLLVVLVVLCSGAVIARADGSLSGRLTDVNEQPVKDATVVITGPGSGPGATVVRVVTDPTGYYVASVATGGAYTVVFSFGRTRLRAHVAIPDGGAATLDSTLAVAGEIIEIQGKRPLQDAKPTSDPLAIPPYSDRAVLEDRWAKAWLLLDVDDHGVVTRLKFLVRPGYDLDAIAVEHGFGLRFDPARDPSGAPTPTYVVWPLEWPSLGWLQVRELPSTRLPVFWPSHIDGNVTVDAGPQGALKVQPMFVMPQYPPCAGEMPVNIGSVHPVLRDCSVPDLAAVDREPWIVRGAELARPVVAAAPVLDPMRVRDEQLAAARANRTRAIVSTATTGALLAGVLVAYLRTEHYADLVEQEEGRQYIAPGPIEQYRHRQRAWQLGTYGMAAGALISGALSMHFWSSSRAELALAPGLQGAQVSYAARF